LDCSTATRQRRHATAGQILEVEIEPDTGKATPPPILDEATLKAFQKWRFKPKKVRRVKSP
jgi:outer membrane biosynthesis protein TonB